MPENPALTENLIGLPKKPDVEVILIACTNLLNSGADGAHALTGMPLTPHGVLVHIFPCHAGLLVMVASLGSIACGSTTDNNAAGDGATSTGCLAVTVDAEAASSGAINQVPAKCVRSVVSQLGNQYIVVGLTPRAGGNPILRDEISLAVSYFGMDVAPVSATEATAFVKKPGFLVGIGYTRYTSQGAFSWRCANDDLDYNDQVAAGTFQLEVTSVETGATFTDTQIHGTLHAVCPPSTRTDLAPAMGKVTIDGPF